MEGDGNLDDHGGGDDGGAPDITFAKSAPCAPAPDPIGSFDNQALHSLPALDGCLLELNLAFNLLSSLEGLAEACPDLDDMIPRPHASEPGDTAYCVRVDDEVLAKRATRAEAARFELCRSLRPAERHPVTN